MNDRSARFPATAPDTAPSGACPPSQVAALRRRIARLHASDEPIDDGELDTCIGLAIPTVLPVRGWLDLLMRYGHHRIDQADLPYSLFRQLYRRLELPPGELLLDLGSGYGRAAFYGALLSKARVHGIELVHERVEEARRVRARWGLDSVELTCADAVTAPWPETGWYCVLNSFLPSVLPLVIARLRAAASRRRIVIASVSTANAAFAAQPWLVELPPVCAPCDSQGLRLFASHPPG
jgi:SAM-dependent methyltransferase